MTYSTVHVDELEAVRGVVRFARRALGVQAFGIEEVNVVIEGSGLWRVDGEEVEARRGTFLRFDPESRRQRVAGPDGMTFIAVGARRGSYEPRGELF